MVKLGLIIMFLSFVFGTITAKKVPKTHGFKVGRIKPGPFEYSEINGFMTPEVAKSLCDGDPQCAGFTYRGSKGSYKPFNIKFYRFVHTNTFKKLGDSDWHWTSYRTSRPYVILPSPVKATELKKKSAKSETDSVVSLLRNETSEWKAKSNAVVVDVVSGEGAEVSDVVDFGKMDAASDLVMGRRVTVVNLEANEKQVVDSGLDGLDGCCKEPKKDISIKETSIDLPPVQRTPCSVSERDLNGDFVSRGIPVVLGEYACAAVCWDRDRSVGQVVKKFEGDGTVGWRVWQEGGKGPKSIKSDVLASLFSKDNVDLDLVEGSFPVTSPAASKMLHHLTDEMKIHPELRSLNARLNFPPRGDEGFAKLTWRRKGQASFLPKKDGTLDSKLTVLKGKLKILLLPFTKSELDCRKKCSDSTSTGSYLSMISPLLKDDSPTFGGSRPLITDLEPGDSLYIPSEWTALVSAEEESMEVVEAAVVSRIIEELAVKMGPQEVTALAKTLSKRDDLRGEYFRMSETLDQIRKATSKQKSKKQKKKN